MPPPIEFDIYLFCRKFILSGQVFETPFPYEEVYGYGDCVGTRPTRRFVLLEWDASDGCFHCFDNLGDCTPGSLSYEELHGGYTGQTGVYIDDHGVLKRLIDGIDPEHPSAGGTVRVVSLDQTWRWMRVDIRCIYDDEGFESKWIIVLTAMGEGRSSQLQIEHLSTDEQAFVETLSAGLGVYRMDGLVPIPVYISKALLDICDISNEECESRIRGQIPGFIFLDEDDVDIEQLLSLKEGRALRFRKLLQRSNGVLACYQVFMMLSYESVIGEDCCKAIVYDITDQVKRERREKRYEERCRLLSEASGVVTFDYDPAADIMVWSTFREDIGSQEQAIGHFLERLSGNDVIHPDSMKPCIEALTEASEHPMSAELECDLDFSGTGYRWCWVRLGMEDEGGHVHRVVGRIDDIQQAKARTSSLEDMLDREAALRRSILCDASYGAGFDLVTGERMELDEDDESLDSNGPSTEGDLADVLIALFERMHPDDRRELMSYRDVGRIVELSRSECRKTDFECRMTSASGSSPTYRRTRVTYAFMEGTETRHPGIFIYLMDIDGDEGGKPADIGQLQESARSCEEPGVEEFCDEHIYIRTFGHFDVFIDGQAVPFRSSRAKELLALLVSRRGGFLRANEAIGYLWENEPVNKTTRARYRKVAMRLNIFLKEYGIGAIVENSKGMRRVVPEAFRCDSYDHPSDNPSGSSSFEGAYMSDYSWGERMLPQLRSMKGERLQDSP